MAEVPNPLIFYDIVLKDFVNNVTLSEFGPSCFVKALVITYLKLSMFWSHFYIKFIYSEKATKFCEI